MSPHGGEQIRLGYKQRVSVRKKELELGKEKSRGKKEEIGSLGETVNRLCSFLLHQDRDAFLVSSAPSPFGKEYSG